ncbi:MAG: hypothetical protein U1F76_29080 [Candidatus Competibacteraceae bacterium]
MTPAAEVGRPWANPAGMVVGKQNPSQDAGWRLEVGRKVGRFRR